MTILYYRITSVIHTDRQHVVQCNVKARFYQGYQLSKSFSYLGDNLQDRPLWELVLNEDSQKFT